jgi:hypothetical protein
MSDPCAVIGGCSRTRDHYLPRQGPVFQTWLDQSDPVGARIAAEKMFTFGVAD